MRRTTHPRAISESSASAADPNGRVPRPRGNSLSLTFSSDLPFPCPDCPVDEPRSFNTKIGLGQHRRKAHTEQYHQENIPAGPATSHTHKSTEELKLLAKAEALYEFRDPSFRGDRAQRLVDNDHTSRSYDAVRKIRQSAEFKTLVSTHLDFLRSQESQPQPPSPIPEEEDVDEIQQPEPLELTPPVPPRSLSGR